MWNNLLLWILLQNTMLPIHAIEYRLHLGEVGMLNIFG